MTLVANFRNEEQHLYGVIKYDENDNKFVADILYMPYKQFRATLVYRRYKTEKAARKIMAIKGLIEI